MNAAFSTVEPGALPRRVRFYGIRRELARERPGRAFDVGLLLGIVCTLAAALIVGLLWP